MKVYNKLVRDRIPEIILSSGNRCETRTLTDAEYAEALREKLREEVEEYLESHDPEELADVLEVVSALAALHGTNLEGIEEIRKDKRRERGGFEKRTLLIASG